MIEWPTIEFRVWIFGWIWASVAFGKITKPLYRWVVWMKVGDRKVRLL